MFDWNSKEQTMKNNPRNNFKTRVATSNVLVAYDPTDQRVEWPDYLETATPAGGGKFPT